MQALNITLTFNLNLLLTYIFLFSQFCSRAPMQVKPGITETWTSVLMMSIDANLISRSEFQTVLRN